MTGTTRSLVPLAVTHEETPHRRFKSRDVEPSALSQAKAGSVEKLEDRVIALARHPRPTSEGSPRPECSRDASPASSVRTTCGSCCPASRQRQLLRGVLQVSSSCFEEPARSKCRTHREVKRLCREALPGCLSVNARVWRERARAQLARSASANRAQAHVVHFSSKRGASAAARARPRSQKGSFEQVGGGVAAPASKRLDLSVRAGAHGPPPA